MKNIAELAAEPQLIQIVLDSDHITSRYGEPLSFYTWDRFDIQSMVEFLGSEDDPMKAIDFCKNNVLDEHGKPVLTGNQVLPGDVAMLAYQEVQKIAGNF